MLQGCATQYTKWYESDYRIRNPIPSDANINIRFGTGKIYKYFRDSKAFIDSAIIKDVEDNILTIKGLRYARDLQIDVAIENFDFREEPWGLLWLPLVYIGFPVSKYVGQVKIIFDIKSSFFQNQYTSKRQIEKWMGIFYGWKYFPYAPNSGIVGMALHQAMDDIKRQIEKDADKYIPPQEKYQQPSVEPPPIVNKPKNLEITPQDVDLNIPKSKIENRDAIAVVIGNCNYADYNIDATNVDFAINDAQTVKAYLINTFGYREGNILYYEDAKLSDFRSVFGTETSPEGRLAFTVKPGMSDVFIYYSGHGAPDINEKRGYFVPVDCRPEEVIRNGYPLDLFYNNLKYVEAKSFTIIIDACFSGAAGNGKMIIPAASPIGISISNPALLLKNSAVFTSSSGNQISSWFPDKGHGLFTYFFLKGLQGAADFDRDGYIKANELYRYLSDKTEGVIYWARHLYMGRQQTPVFYGDENMIIRGPIK